MMNIQNRSLDTSKNLSVERFRQGIRLIDSSAAGLDECISVARLFDLPMPVYFYDVESNFIDVNEDCAMLVAAESVVDMRGKCPANFCSKEFSEKIIAIDNSVMRNESMSLVEEVGFRSDDTLIQCMSLKLPWYEKDKIVGLLGFSIKTDNHSLDEFANRMSSLIATGLMGPSSYLNSLEALKIDYQDIYFSNREKQVLSYLVRGRTAKEIAASVNLSKRTVEHYIEHIKVKSKCATRSELVDKFSKWGQV